jgi:hypothetical protein
LQLIDTLLDILGASRATEICLEPRGRAYLARSPAGTHTIDRRLALLLRRDGATWRGRVEDDPCAVA